MRTLESRILRKASVRFGEGRAEKCLQRQLAGRLLYLVVLCRSHAEAQTALETVRGWVEANGLSLHPTKTRLVDASQLGGFDFLGYHFEWGMKWPRAKSLKQLKDTIRQKTRRSQGRSLKAICADLNGTLRGWFGYFKHSHYTTTVRL